MLIVTFSLALYLPVQSMHKMAQQHQEELQAQGQQLDQETANMTGLITSFQQSMLELLKGSSPQGASDAAMSMAMQAANCDA